MLSDGTVPTPFGSAGVVEPAGPDGDTLELEPFVDHGLVERLLGGGVDVATMLFFPAEPAGAVSVAFRI